MALPQINETIYHPVTIPSTGKVFEFRPYIVKEEKVLLIAYESGDQPTILDAIKNTVSSCCKQQIDIEKLALFDVEYIFAQLRSISVGQTSTLVFRCKQDVDGELCNHNNEVEVDISAIKVDVPDQNPTVKLNDKFTADLRYPSYKDGITFVGATTQPTTQTMFDLLGKCVLSVRSDDEIYSFADEPREEIDKWLETLNSVQLGKLFEFINNMPKLSHPIEYTCGKCGHQHKLTLEGLSDFF